MVTGEDGFWNPDEVFIVFTDGNAM